MMNKRLILLLCLIHSLLWVGSVFAQEQAEKKKANETVQEKIERLGREVRELQDGLGMYMENLGNCVEENKELDRKLNALEKGADSEDYAEKLHLIKRLQNMLNADADMTFLLRLSEEDLEKLVEAVQQSPKKME